MSLKAVLKRDSMPAYDNSNSNSNNNNNNNNNIKHTYFVRC